MEQLILLDASYLPQMAELYKISFAGEPWNDDWSDTEQLMEYMKEISGSYNALNFGLLQDVILQVVRNDAPHEAFVFNIALLGVILAQNCVSNPMEC